jgi:hypothetical protein
MITVHLKTVHNPKPEGSKKIRIDIIMQQVVNLCMREKNHSTFPLIIPTVSDYLPNRASNKSVFFMKFRKNGFPLMWTRGKRVSNNVTPLTINVRV